MKKTKLYKDTVTDLNIEYRRLIDHFRIGDCRKTYLIVFELVLSQNLPGESLWENPTYFRVSHKYPLRTRNGDYVSRDLFQLYIMLYEKIMRDVGLVGAAAEEPPETPVFDLEDD